MPKYKRPEEKENMVRYRLKVEKDSRPRHSLVYSKSTTCNECSCFDGTYQGVHAGWCNQHDFPVWSTHMACEFYGEIDAQV